jgi:hypothetical protein
VAREGRLHDEMRERPAVGHGETPSQRGQYRRQAAEESLRTATRKQVWTTSFAPPGIARMVASA